MGMGIGINLNDLIFDENESFEEPKTKKSFHFKSDIKRKRTEIKSPNRKYRRYSEESVIFKTPLKNVLYKGIKNIKNSRTVIRLKNINKNNYNDKEDNSKNDDDFLSELLFRLIDY